MGRILAIDWGSKRLGLALGSTEAKLPRPFKIVDNTKDSWNKLAEIIKSEDAEKIVIGLPRNMDGSEGAQARTVRQFGKELSEYLKLPVVFQDETLTSVAASQSGLTRVDAEAAAIILQDYLNSL